MVDGKDKKGAAVRFSPPLIFVILIFAGGLAGYYWPVGMGVPASFQIVGFALIVFGVAIAFMVNSVFKRADTAIEPWKPTTNIVTTGVYRWSRNPIYTGFCLVNMGIGISANNFWIFVSFIPGAILVYIIAIAKEESYLEGKFGEEYLAYKAKVRRWL